MDTFLHALTRAAVVFEGLMLVVAAVAAIPAGIIVWAIWRSFLRKGPKP